MKDLSLLVLSMVEIDCRSGRSRYILCCPRQLLSDADTLKIQGELHAGFPYFEVFVIVPCALLTMLGVSTWLTAGLMFVDMLKDSILIIAAGA